MMHLQKNNIIMINPLFSNSTEGFLLKNLYCLEWIQYIKYFRNFVLTEVS